MIAIAYRSLLSTNCVYAQYTVSTASESPMPTEAKKKVQKDLASKHVGALCELLAAALSN